MATSENFVIIPRTNDPAFRLVGVAERMRDLTGYVRHEPSW